MPPTPPHTHTINATAPAVFNHCFEVADQDMRGLYEKAKRDQWNASRDIDWSQGLDSDRGILPDGLVDIYGTIYWNRLSQLMYGEEFAMMVCSQLVNVVPGLDAKFFMATQVMDEARHSEVLARYVHDKVGVVYPLTSNLRRLFDRILEVPQWYLKTVGTQLVAETLDVSIFRMMAKNSQDPLICQICKRILADESRHMGFGMLSLPEQVSGLSEREVREVEDFACEALVLSMQGQFPREAYEAVGFNKTEIEAIKQLRHEIAQKNEHVMFRKYFRRDFHSTLWNNLSRVGLLSERAIEKLGTLGIAAPQQSAAA